VEGDPPPESDTGQIVYAFRRWRGEPKPAIWDEKKHGPWDYADVPGFCKAAALAEIEKHAFVLTPGRYVGAEEVEDDGEPFEEKFPRLLAELEEQFAEGEKLMAVVRQKLGRLDYGS
jgi:type I restriction enzyme M protein